MGFSWTGFTGDGAATYAARKPNTALISTTVWDGDHWIGPGTLESVVIDGQTIYPNIWVDCLTPGARMAVVTDVDLGSGALQLEVSPLVFADSGEDWAPGVHLFAFAVGHGGQQTETVATVVVPKGKVKKALKLSAAGMRAYMVAGRGARPGR